MRIKKWYSQIGLQALVVGLLFVGTIVSSPNSQAGDEGFKYPRVYGPTGKLYGPTQAHYQYQLQYGRPWHGYRGLTAPISSRPIAYRLPAFPSFYGYGTCYGYGNSYGAVPFYGRRFFGNPYYYESSYFGNNWWWSSTGFYGSNFNVPDETNYVPAPIRLKNIRMKEQVSNNRREWAEKISGMPDRVIIAVKPSTAKQQIRSVRLQEQGDVALRRGLKKRAYDYYSKAVKLSSDQAEFRISLAIVLAETGRFEAAAKQIEAATKLQSDFTVFPRTLEQVYGSDALNRRETLLGKLYEWTSEETEDPQRLFLMGAMLALDGNDPDSRPFLEAAAALAHDDSSCLVFLRPIRERMEAFADSLPDTLLPAGMGVLKRAVPAEEADDAPSSTATTDVGLPIPPVPN